jgi:hypothetical protein
MHSPSRRIGQYVDVTWLHALHGAVLLYIVLPPATVGRGLNRDRATALAPGHEQHTLLRPGHVLDGNEAWFRLGASEAKRRAAAVPQARLADAVSADTDTMRRTRRALARPEGRGRASRDNYS